MVTERYRNELMNVRGLGFERIEIMAAILDATEDTPRADFEFALKYIKSREIPESKNKKGFPYTEFDKVRNYLGQEDLTDSEIKSAYTYFCNSLKRSLPISMGERRNSGEILLELAKEMHPEFNLGSLEA